MSAEVKSLANVLDAIDHKIADHYETAHSDGPKFTKDEERIVDAVFSIVNLKADASLDDLDARFSLIEDSVNDGAAHQHECGQRMTSAPRIVSRPETIRR